MFTNSPYQLATGSLRPAAALAIFTRQIQMANYQPQIIWLSDTPYPGKDVPACLTRAGVAPANCAFKLQVSEQTRQLAGVASALGAQVVRPADFLCPAPATCPAVHLDGAKKLWNLYRDSSHLSQEGAISAARNLEFTLK
jgi:hypothetical protein